MFTSQVHDKPSNKTLDTLLLELQQESFETSNNTNIRTYTKLSQLGLSNSVTMTEIIESMPVNSILMFDAYTETHTGLDISTSGRLHFYKGGLNNKAYAEFRHENYFLVRTYNDYYSPPLQEWEGVSGRITDISNSHSDKIANIPFDNITYYFSSSEAPKLTDRPSGAGSSGAIVTRITFGNGAKLFTYTENNAGLKRWQATLTNGSLSSWVAR